MFVSSAWSPVDSLSEANGSVSLLIVIHETKSKTTHSFSISGDASVSHVVLLDAVVSGRSATYTSYRFASYCIASSSHLLVLRSFDVSVIQIK